MWGVHGVDEDEKVSPQPFDVDVVLEIDLQRAGKSDQLDDTVNYAQLHEQIVSIVRTTNYNLLERLADHLCDCILSDKRVQGAKVTIAKPNKLNGATPCVTLTRHR